MKPFVVDVFSQKETAALAKTLALKIKKTLGKRKIALAIGLSGILGSGKTTFVRKAAKALGIRRKILSPSFLIFKKYPLPARRKGAGPGYQPRNARYYLMHVDCYRLKKPNELLALKMNYALRTRTQVEKKRTDFVKVLEQLPLFVGSSC